MLNLDSYGFSAPAPKSKTQTKAPKAYKAKVKGIAAQCLAILADRPSTSEEIEKELGRSHTAVSPRMSELKAAGQICDSGIMRTNDSGLDAHVMRLTTAHERSLYVRTDHVGWQMKQDRQKAGWSIDGLAYDTGITCQKLEQIESGEKKPTVEEAYKIGKAL